ncbi:MAG: hypothetical protein Q8P10_02325 [bacterium]|nr:hypothetical protein [bacterium]
MNQLDFSVFNGGLLQTAFLTKIALLILVFLFFIFTFVVFTQVNGMNKIITKIEFSGILKILAILNIIAALSLFLFILVTL